MTDLLAAVRQLQERLKDATKPPWWVSHHPDNVEHFIEPEIGTVDEGNEADAAFVVAAVNLVGPLIADWERRGAALNETREALANELRQAAAE